ncbi:glycosyltransferase [Vibrio mediterranei]
MSIDNAIDSKSQDSICFTRGDIFFDIDASWSEPLDRGVLFRKLKEKGVIICCMHYDAVPLLFPSYSHPNTVVRFYNHLSAQLLYCDHFICISNTVEADLQEISKKYLGKKAPTCVVPLGADFDEVSTNVENISSEVSELSNKSFILCVGTIEPRKNHEMLLEAFDMLSNQDINLILVGKKGWNIDEFCEELLSHPQFGKRIFWLSGINDQELNRLYQSSKVCVNTSHYEGFGLPVIEALHHMKPVICSNISAFHEITGGRAIVLQENTATCLAKELDMFLDNERCSLSDIEIGSVDIKNWDQAYISLENEFLELLYGREIDFDKSAYQAIYISISPSNIDKSLRTVSQNAPFITDILLLTNDAHKSAMDSVLSQYDFNYQIITDEELMDARGIDVTSFCHTKRNTILRKELYKLPSVKSNFIQFDDDYLVQYPINYDIFFSDGKVNCYYYGSADDWLGSPYEPTAYDGGILNTKQLMHRHGYACKSYSSHMPQMVNKKLVNFIFESFVNFDSPAFDEWSLYFNVASHLYPKRFSPHRYVVLSWPSNPTDWVPEKLPEEFIFENYYPSNYQKGGKFEQLDIFGQMEEKRKIWQSLFKLHYLQQALNLKLFDEKNPIIEIDSELNLVTPEIIEFIPGILLRLVLDSSFTGEYIVQSEFVDNHGKKYVFPTVSGSSFWVPIQLNEQASSGRLTVLISSQCGLSSSSYIELRKCQNSNN